MTVASGMLTFDFSFFGTKIFPKLSSTFRARPIVGPRFTSMDRGATEGLTELNPWKHPQRAILRISANLQDKAPVAWPTGLMANARLCLIAAVQFHII